MTNLHNSRNKSFTCRQHGIDDMQ